MRHEKRASADAYGADLGDIMAASGSLFSSKSSKRKVTSNNFRKTLMRKVTTMVSVTNVFNDTTRSEGTSSEKKRKKLKKLMTQGSLADKNLLFGDELERSIKLRSKKSKATNSPGLKPTNVESHALAWNTEV